MTGIGCSTCMESFTSRCDVSTTPCAHVFHTDCLTQWLGTKQNNCPQCRKYCSLGQICKLYFSEVEKEDLVNELLDENEKLKLALEKKNSTFGHVSQPKPTFGSEPAADGDESNTQHSTQSSTFQIGSASGSNTHIFGAGPLTGTITFLK